MPFRDSNLTRVLEGSLGGLCRTSLLVCVAPEMYHATETQSTLEFAARAIAIVAKPVVFQVRAGYKKTQLPFFLCVCVSLCSVSPWHTDTTTECRHLTVITYTTPLTAGDGVVGPQGTGERAGGGVSHRGAGAHRSGAPRPAGGQRAGRVLCVLYRGRVVGFCLIRPHLCGGLVPHWLGRGRC